MGHREPPCDPQLSAAKNHDCRHHPRGSVRRASGFVLTGNPEVIVVVRRISLATHHSQLIIMDDGKLTNVHPGLTLRLPADIFRTLPLPQLAATPTRCTRPAPCRMEHGLARGMQGSKSARVPMAPAAVNPSRRKTRLQL